MEPVENNTNFIANSSAYLTIELHCIGADSLGTWSYSKGDLGDLFLVTNYSSGSQALSYNSVFDGTADEGYYDCEAANESGQSQVLSVGLFAHGRGKGALPPMLMNGCTMCPMLTNVQ